MDPMVIAQVMKREVRFARITTSVSLLLAAVSAVMMAVFALRPSGALQSSAPAVDAVVGLNAAGESMEQEGVQGWYRTYLSGVVRTEEELESQELAVLPVDTLVYVAEVRGRRARILKPNPGWMSMRTDDGVELLRPDRTYIANPDETDLQAILRSREVRDANKRLQESAMKMTVLEKKLMDTVRNLKFQHLGESINEKTAHAVQQAPKVGMSLAKEATHAFKKAVKPGAEQKIAEQIQRSSHVQGLFHHPKVEGLVDQVKAKLGDIDQVKAKIGDIHDEVERTSKNAKDFEDFEASLTSATGAAGDRLAV